MQFTENVISILKIKITACFQKVFWVFFPSWCYHNNSNVSISNSEPAEEITDGAEIKQGE